MAEPAPATRAPAALDRLLDRMMALRPEDRFSGYEELLCTLDRLSPHATQRASGLTRALATAIDLLVTALLSVPLAFFLDDIDSSIILPMFGVYTLLSHGLWGRTLGKLALEIEVVPINRRGRLGLRTAAVRWLVAYGPLMLLEALDGWSGVIRPPGYKTLHIVFGGGMLFLIVVTFLWTTIRMSISPWYRPIWDRVAGTIVRYRGARPVPRPSRPHPSPAPAPAPVPEPS